MKLLIVLAVCIAAAYASCVNYCQGTFAGSNCEASIPIVWRDTECAQRCLQRCNDMQMYNCNSNFYKCCLTAHEFNVTFGCWRAAGW